ncbi:MAG: AAA family ATPase [bacterium]|nr:AAA family ATPase [bacterium]
MEFPGNTMGLGGMQPPGVRTEQQTALGVFTRDLTEDAKQGNLDPVIGRDEEIRRIMQVLSRRTKNNPVLIGEPGVGKTAIVEGLAQRIVAGDVPDTLKNKHVITLDLGSIMAGSAFRGEFEARIKAVIKEVTAEPDKYIMFLDELHTLVGAGAQEGSLDAANLLKPFLARGQLRLVGATTLKEYQKYIERDSALERRFQPVNVSEPSVDDTIAILRGLKEKYELHQGVRIADSAILAAAELSDRYISDRFLPDKAVDLIDEATSALRIDIESEPENLYGLKRRLLQLEIEQEALSKEKDTESRNRSTEIASEIGVLREEIAPIETQWKAEREVISRIRELKGEIDRSKAHIERLEREGDLAKVAQLKYQKIPALTDELEEQNKFLRKIPNDSKMLKEEITDEDVASIVSKWTGIPVKRMLASEAEKLSHLEDELGERVIGQRAAIKAVANSIRRSRAGINEEKRPIGSFIFLGPTGVGKTELAKALAEQLFDDEDAVIRVDMSEYMERHSAAKLVGAPPGYVGYEEGGQLTEKVRRKPYSVILFDEIEKAAPDVFNVLLQVLDDGRLTDAKGRSVNFKNTIIIMTSNIGTEMLNAQAIGFHDGVDKEERVAYDDAKKKVLDELKHSFKPEFLNRVDHIIVFDPLTKAELREIAKLQINLVRERLVKKHIDFQVTDKVIDFIVKEGYDPMYGARPLKRVIQEKILDRLASQIIANELAEEAKVTVDVAGKDKLVFKTDKAKVAPGA